MRKKLPLWLKKDIIDTEKTGFVRKVLRNSGLNTVCDEARCPNKGECYANNTATFMIMGKNCSRNCKFCSVNFALPEKINSEEPSLIAEAVKKLGLCYAVVTSVTRDDLQDGGATHFAQTICEIKTLNPKTKVEVLTPDFKGNEKLIDIVIEAKPDVFNHNIETVKRIFPTARPQGSYERSLKFLEYIKQTSPKIPVKSGFMMGLGESFEEARELLRELKDVGCDIVTVGQYIQSSRRNLEVERYLEPTEFEKIKEEAFKIGIKRVIAAPLARSSYKAHEIYVQ